MQITVIGSGYVGLVANALVIISPPRSLQDAKESIGCWIDEYNHDRPHRALNNRTPREARAGFAQLQPLTKTEALGV